MSGIEKFDWHKVTSYACCVTRYMSKADVIMWLVMILILFDVGKFNLWRHILKYISASTNDFSLRSLTISKSSEKRPFKSKNFSFWSFIANNKMKTCMQKSVNKITFLQPRGDVWWRWIAIMFYEVFSEIFSLSLMRVCFWHFFSNR